MIKTKEKYRLCWMDAYNLANWGGIEEIKKAYPVSDYSIDVDGWADCCHCYTFEASGIDEVRKKINEYLEEIGRIVDVFSVYNSNNDVVLTEEDI
jgi:hypothetical protein